MATTQRVLIVEADEIEAAQLQRDAMATAKQWGDVPLIQRLAGNLSRYERREPCRTPWSDDDPVHAPGPKVEPDLLETPSIAPRSR